MSQVNSVRCNSPTDREVGGRVGWRDLPSIKGDFQTAAQGMYRGAKQQIVRVKILKMLSLGGSRLRLIDSGKTHSSLVFMPKVLMKFSLHCSGDLHLKSHFYEGQDNLF